MYLAWSLADRFKVPPDYWLNVSREQLWEAMAYLVVSGDGIGKRYLENLFKVDHAAHKQITHILTEARSHGGRKK